MLGRRRLLGTLGLVGSATLAWLGCEGHKNTEIVAGFTTQVQVPRDVRQVRLDVRQNGQPILCQSYKAFDGKVLLPKTLGNLPNSDPAQPVSITITGFTDEVPVADGCALDPRVGTVNAEGTPPARVLRRSVQQYASDRVVYLAMPLRYSCFDKDCDTQEGQTCKAGRCVSATTDPNALPDYDEELVLGNSATCFNVGICMKEDLLLNAWTVDDATCTFAVPGSKDSPPAPEGVTAPPAGPGLNVRVVYDGGFTKEILDLDPEEGFIIPDAAKPQQFKLAPALCDLYHGVDTSSAVPAPTAHRIVGVEVGSICQPKTPRQAICAADQLALMTANNDGTVVDPGPGCKNGTLAPSANGVIVLADNSPRMKEFYIAAATDAPVGDAGVPGQSEPLSATVARTLQDPSLQVTQLGFAFIPKGTSTSCDASASLTFDVQPELADAASLKIDTAMKNQAIALSSPGPSSTPLELAKSLVGAYNALRTNPKFATAAKRAVLVLANSELLAAESLPKCQPIATLVAGAKADGIETFIILVGKNGDATPATDAATILGGVPCSAGSTSNCADGRGSAGKGALGKYYDLVGQVAGCLYDPPAGLSLEKADLAATKLAFHATVAIPKDAKVAYNENTSDPSGGFHLIDGTGGKKIEIFGSPCNDLRESLKTTGFFSVGFGQKAPGVSMYFQQKCQ